MGNAINRTTFLEAYDWADSIVDGTSVSFRLTNFGTTSINGLIKWWLLNIADFDNAVYASDFSAGADGWVATNGAVAGNQDGVSDGSTSKDDCIKYTNDAANNVHLMRITPLVVGTAYRATVTYYIPPGQSNIDGFFINSTSGPIWGEARSTSLTPATIGTWTTITFEFVANLGTFAMYACDGANTTYQDAGGDDVIYISEVSIKTIIEAYSINTLFSKYADGGAEE